MAEETIGFDLRSVLEDPSWTAARRARLLLRHDVPAVRSVDTMAWRRPDWLPRAPVPEGLWPDLSALSAAAHGLEHAGTVVVRITAFGEDEQAPESFGGYQLLGYDVADYDLLGGLSNCGYTPDEAASLTAAWVPLLNDWHLFAAAQDAEAYAAVTTQRVPEHAPFYRYGLYQLG